MQNADQAIEVILKHEGGYLESAANGEISNFGITLALLVSLKGHELQRYGLPQKPNKEDVKTLKVEIAKRIYRDKYWDPIMLNQVTSFKLALKMLDMAVNMGPGTAVKLFQTALREDLKTSCVIDGKMGPQTIFMMNNVEVEPLLIAVRKRQESHYRSLVEKNPKLAVFLNGWIKRTQLC